MDRKNNNMARGKQTGTLTRRTSARTRAAPLRLEEEQAQLLAFASFGATPIKCAGRWATKLHKSDESRKCIFRLNKTDSFEMNETNKFLSSESSYDNVSKKRKRSNLATAELAELDLEESEVSPPYDKNNRKVLKTDDPTTVTDVKLLKDSSIKTSKKPDENTSKLNSFQVTSEDFAQISRLAPIGLYFASNEQDDKILTKKYVGVTRRQQRGVVVYQARLSYKGTSLNLGASHKTSADAAAAVDLALTLLHGSESERPLNILSRNEALRALKAAGAKLSFGLNRYEPDEVMLTGDHKRIFELMVMDALVSLGACDEDLCDILLNDLGRDWSLDIQDCATNVKYTDSNIHLPSKESLLRSRKGTRSTRIPKVFTSKPIISSSIIPDEVSSCDVTRLPEVLSIDQAKILQGEPWLGKILLSRSDLQKKVCAASITSHFSVLQDSLKVVSQPDDESKGVDSQLSGVGIWNNHRL